jgi:hypothetical protein
VCGWNVARPIFFSCVKIRIVIVSLRKFENLPDVKHIALERRKFRDDARYFKKDSSEYLQRVMFLI